MKKFIIITLAITAFLFVPFLLSPESEMTKALRVCKESNQVIDGDLEEECGRLQKATNTEFLCDGIEAETHCWLETK